MTEDERLDGIMDSVDMRLSKLRELVMEGKLGAGYCPWGCKGSGMTEQLHFHFHVIII